MSGQESIRDFLPPGMKAVLDFFSGRAPLAISIPICHEYPNVFLSLSDEQQDDLIAEAFNHSMRTEANNLMRIKFGISAKEKPSLKTHLKALTDQESKRVLPGIAELNAQIHPMRNVLSTLETANKLLGLVDEQLYVAEDQLSDIATGPDDPGLTDTDTDFIEQISQTLYSLCAELGQLSEYYRAKAGMV